MYFNLRLSQSQAVLNDELDMEELSQPKRFTGVIQLIDVSGMFFIMFYKSSPFYNDI